MRGREVARGRVPLVEEHEAQVVTNASASRLWSYADVHGLLRLRTANRAWRDRANALLSTHLVRFSMGRVSALVRGDLVGHPGFHEFKGERTWSSAMASLHVVDVVGLSQAAEVIPIILPDGILQIAPAYIRMWENSSQNTYEPEDLHGPPHTVLVFGWERTPFPDPGPCMCDACDWEEGDEHQAQSGPQTETASLEVDTNYNDHLVCPETVSDGEKGVAGEEEEADRHQSEHESHGGTCAEETQIEDCDFDVLSDSSSSVEPDFSSRYTPFDNLSDGTHKLVVNMSPKSSLWDLDFSSSTTIDMGPGAEHSCHTLTEIVVNMIIPEGEDLASILPYTLVNLLFEIQLVEIKYTIVNSEAVPLSILREVYLNHLDVATAWDAFRRETCFEACAEAWLNHRCRDYLDLRPTVEYLSSEEYEARVGTERYRIETMECPW